MWMEVGVHGGGDGLFICVAVGLKKGRGRRKEATMVEDTFVASRPCLFSFAILTSTNSYSAATVYRQNEKTTRFIQARLSPSRRHPSPRPTNTTASLHPPRMYTLYTHTTPVHQRNSSLDRIHLRLGVRRLERGERHQRGLHPHERGEGREVDLEAPGVVELRDERRIGERDGVAHAVAAG